MNVYVVSALVAFGLTALFLPPIIRSALKSGRFTPPIRPRDVHQKPVPRVGGLVMVATFVVVLLLVQAIWPGELQFSGQKLLGLDKNLVGVILGLLILSAVNIWDDLKDVSWHFKLLGQIGAALVVAFFGVEISVLSNPFGDQLTIGHLSWLFVVLWIVITCNVINWLDSIDGVAGGVSGIALLILMFLSLAPHVNQPGNAVLAAIGFGVVLGFLPFNLRGRVFLGDTGSMFLGFLIGVIAIISGGKVATAFLVLAIPFLDALVVFVKRVLAGQSPFLADRRHLIHRLMDLGLKRHQILLVYYALSLIFGLVALNTQTLGKVWAIAAAVLVMVLLVILSTVRKRQS